MNFQCQESCGGKCCNANWDNSAGFVFLTWRDRKKLVNFLGKKLEEFASFGQFTFTRFLNKPSYQWYLKGAEKSCPFLKEGKCSVYEARPTQCRTFPFWPELMTEAPWKALKEFCPGIDKGEPTTHFLLSEQIKADKELKNRVVHTGYEGLCELKN